MKNLTLFISSSDDYADCWQPFFFLLQKFWPDCNLPIVLNTESKSFAYDGLNVICTKAGTQKRFGETFHKGLDQIKTDNILLLMIDYFLMDKVDGEQLRNIYQAFVQRSLDGLYLVEMKTIQTTVPLTENISLIAGPGQDRFSFQAAIWKKSSLKKYVLNHETPWLAEQFGSMRFQYAKDRLAFVYQSIEPFKYLHTGVLHKGGWVKEAVPVLEGLGIALNWNARGFYEWKKPALAQRLMKRRKTALLEAKSRLHLLAVSRGWRVIESLVESRRLSVMLLILSSSAVKL
jgi:hypothetical protein